MSDHDETDPITGDELPGLDPETRDRLAALGPPPGDPEDVEAWTLRRLALLVPLARQVADYLGP